MGILSRLLGIQELKKARILVLGASGSGKTTFVQFLMTGKTVEQNPRTTLGIDIRKKSINIEDNWTISTIDVGGQDVYRKTFWSIGIGQANAVIFLIDGTLRPTANSDGYETSRFAFDYMAEILPFDKPILILINKQDLKDLNPVLPEEAVTLYNMSRLDGRTFKILPCSAKYGDGVISSLQWLLKKIEE